MVSVSASINLPLHHKVQKFSSGTGSPGWSWKKGRKMVVFVLWCGGVPPLKLQLYGGIEMSVFLLLLLLLFFIIIVLLLVLLLLSCLHSECTDGECLSFAGSEFLGTRINVRHAAKKPPSQQQHQPPRGKGYYYRHGENPR